MKDFNSLVFEGRVDINEMFTKAMLELIKNEGNAKTNLMWWMAFLN